MANWTGLLRTGLVFLWTGPGFLWTGLGFVWTGPGFLWTEPGILEKKDLPRGGSGSLTAFTAPQDGLLLPHKVYCSLTRFTAASPRFTAASLRFTAASLRFTEPTEKDRHFCNYWLKTNTYLGKKLCYDLLNNQMITAPPPLNGASCRAKRLKT